MIFRAYFPGILVFGQIQPKLTKFKACESRHDGNALEYDIAIEKERKQQQQTSNS